MHSERQQLWDAIIDDPVDQVRRMIFGDWLREHDEEDLADFVATQFEVEGLDGHTCDRDMAYTAVTSSAMSASVTDEKPTLMVLRQTGAANVNDIRIMGCSQCVRKAMAQQKAARLARDNRQRWTTEWAFEYHLSWVKKALTPTLQGSHIYDGNILYRFVQGFISEITCSFNQWMRIFVPTNSPEPPIVRQYPITSVIITGKSPRHLETTCSDHRNDEWIWCSESEFGEPPAMCIVPPGVFRYMTRDDRWLPEALFCVSSRRVYHSAEAATRWLRYACLAYAREMAGLPKLEPIGMASQEEGNEDD